MSFNATCTVHNGHVFLSGQASAQTRIFRVDIEKGSFVWEHQGGGLTGPVIANGKVYIGSHVDPPLSIMSMKRETVTRPTTVYGSTKWEMLLLNLAYQSQVAKYSSSAPMVTYTLLSRSKSKIHSRLKNIIHH